MRSWGQIGQPEGAACVGEIGSNGGRCVNGHRRYGLESGRVECRANQGDRGLPGSGFHPGDDGKSDKKC